MDDFAKNPPYLIKPVGDCAALAVFGDRIGDDVSARVMALDSRVRSSHMPGIGETVPAFASLLVHYDPMVTDYRAVKDFLLRHGARPQKAGRKAGRTVEIPVCYGGGYGEDLPFVARHAGLSEQEVIERHCGRPYRIYMLGFLPGFPYLGGLDERLFTPRLSNPRTRIPAGSVGIGGEQTGIYPLESPGGWQLIGRTPLCLFDPAGGGSLPYAAGDFIRFVPVSAREYSAIEAKQIKDKETETWQWRFFRLGH